MLKLVLGEKRPKRFTGIPLWIFLGGCFWLFLVYFFFQGMLCYDGYLEGCFALYGYWFGLRMRLGHPRASVVFLSGHGFWSIHRGLGF